MIGERFTDFGTDAVTVARRLLGQRLVRVLDGRRLAGTIVEVEAYLGPEDAAAHCSGGRRTERNESMYLPGGHAYVYFVYGMHWCMNVVCGPRDHPTAVLLRGLEPTEGIDAMYARRAAARRDRDLCSGPARLTEALGIDRRFDGADLRGDAALAVERVRRRALPARLIVTTPRIGVAYAGAWARHPLRFCVRGNEHVSRR
ncbi:MAG: DNA-3-methyladenine glycosylase [Planctomycetes bacterium]|nr:DNA-3-methyladenine glycosylase [Planctomycetota bacterium]